MPSKGEVKQELLIIRRAPHEDLTATKGGAWKIAYADFVTAMMAFFLVMWLINSANEVTKSRVASYFNPIKMTDAAPVRKGLRENVEPKSQKTNVDSNEAGGGGSSETKSGGGQVQLSREKLLENPMTALDLIEELSGKSRTQQAAVEEGVGDPFDPKSANQGAHQDHKSTENQALAPDKRQPIANRDDIGPQQEMAEMVTSVENAPDPAANNHPSAGENDEKVEKTGAKNANPATDTKNQLKEAEAEREALEATKAEFKANEEKEAMDLQREIRTQLMDLRGALDVNVSVKVTSEGTLVVFEDGKKRSMFAVGSASPNPALITLLAKVGELLNKRDEPVVIRGHTDGRRFRIETYDNWQLSTDRAHMASYMLIRGGLPESRLMRIEGYGSSQPVVPENIFADENRRVEFLLARPSP